MLHISSRLPRLVTRSSIASFVMLTCVSCSDGNTGPKVDDSIWIARVGESPHVGVPGAMVWEEPQIKVARGIGIVVPGATVTFTASGGGHVSKPTVITNAEGYASAGEWTLGPGAGDQTLTARSGDASVVFVVEASRPFAGTARFDQITIGGAYLPLTVTSGPSMTQTLLRTHLSLSDDGRAVISRIVRTTIGGITQDDSTVAEGRWRQSGAAPLNAAKLDVWMSETERWIATLSADMLVAEYFDEWGDGYKDVYVKTP